MKSQNTQLKRVGSRITSTRAGLLIRLNTYGAAVLSLFFASATLLITSAASAATITVINTNDSGPDSLRQALINANDGDTINFDSSLKGQRITLSTGQLNVDKDVTISGPGAKNLAVDGNAQSRVFYVNPGKTVTIDGLTVANGYSYSSGEGAGIFNDAGALAITNCVLSRNSAVDGGGIASDGYNGSAILTVTNCTISGNLAAESGGGISNFAYVHDATLTVTNCTISDNSAGDGGDGIGNAAAGGNATLTITNSTITGNGSLVSPSGGGISNVASGGNATLTITNSTISGNSAGNGGGIDNHGYNASAILTVINCTISGNSSYEGGGIFNDSYQEVATVTITNSTISGNSAIDGGGVYSLAGSAFSSGNSIVAISNSTIAGNSATGHAACIFNYAYAGFAAVETGNTIFDAGASGENIFNFAGTVTSRGYNLSSDNGGGYLTATGDQINTDPVLGPLQDNGGPTFTHALLPGSPAIDSGDPNFTPPPFYDQRGSPFHRIVNGHVDKGSLEVQAPRTSPTPRPRPTPVPRS